MYGNIDYLLRAWGRWSVRIDLGGMGYSGKSSMFRLTPAAQYWQSTPPEGLEDYDLAAVAHSVDRLPPELKIICVLTYREERSLRDVGAILGTHHGVVRNRLRKAQERIAEWLRFPSPPVEP